MRFNNGISNQFIIIINRVEQINENVVHVVRFPEVAINWRH